MSCSCVIRELVQCSRKPRQRCAHDDGASFNPKYAKYANHVVQVIMIHQSMRGLGTTPSAVLKLIQVQYTKCTS